MPISLIKTLRTLLYIGIVAVVFLLYQTWEHEHPATKSNVAINEEQSQTQQNEIIPVALQQTTVQTARSLTKNEAEASTPLSTVQVTTDLFQATIDPIGGNIIEFKLLDYPKNLDSPERVQLLNNLPQTRYVAQSGLLGQAGPDTAEGLAHWTVDQTQYVLQPNQNQIDVKMHYRNAAGVLFTKVFTFKRNDYEVGMQYKIENASDKAWLGNLYLKLSRKNAPTETHHGLSSFATYFGAALSTPEKTYQKVSFSDMTKAPIDKTAKGGWIAMVQHYFVGAWVPEDNASYHYFSQVSSDQLYTLGALGPVIEVQPGQSLTTGAEFYAGPAIADRLQKVAPHLQLTIDYGWLWMISGAIFWLMQKIYSVIGNWGWSIVLVTLMIKLGFYHLSAKSYRSMGALRRLQPKINALRERYADDKQKMTQATLELYRTEKVNPMSGCLPVLVQIPVFIALYWVLVESIQLRQAPFIFWIKDLSVADPFYILPIMMGLSMFVQQRLSPAPPDPTQAKVMMLMPVFFTAMFAKFPAGLMLYWFVNNSLSCLQQWYIMKTADSHALKQKQKRR